MLLQGTSIFGAALILVAYAAPQAGWTGRDSFRYHLLNAAGGMALLVVAIDTVQIGFIILEAVWTIVSLGAMFRMWRRPGRA